MALLVICAVLSLVLLGDAAIRAGIGTALLFAPWLLLVLWAVYVVGVASRIHVQPEGVLVQNLLRRTYVPWQRVRRVGMRWQLEITLDDGRVLTCFGGPVRTRPQRLGPGRTREDTGGAADDMVAALRRTMADAGVGRVAEREAQVRRSWDLPAIAVLLVLVGWAVAAVLIAYG